MRRRDKDIKIKIGYAFSIRFCAGRIVRGGGETVAGFGMGTLAVDSITWRTLGGLSEEETVQGIGWFFG